MKPLGIAVLGAGNIAKVHVEAIRHLPDARVSVVSSRNREHGERLASNCGADWSGDYREAVTHPDVDIVCVCTPSGMHAEFAIAAARAGKHLIVEKPLEITLDRVDSLLAVVRETGVKLTCIFPLRFMDGVQRTKTALEAGRLGCLALADAYVKWHRSPSYYQGGWRGTWALDGGGVLMNQSVHSVDLLQWLGGPVRSVFGRTATLVHAIETEDTASAVLEFEHGALGVIQGATSTWPGEAARLDLRGEGGAITLSEGRITTWKLQDADDEEEKSMLALEQVAGSGSQDPTAITWELHRRQIADMLAAIHENREPIISGAEARKSVEIVRAIYLSAKWGCPVNLPLEKDHD